MSLNMKQRLTALLYWFGQSCRARRWDYLAERIFRWAVSLTPGSPDLHFALSQQAIAAGNLDDACGRVLSLLRLAPQHPVPGFNPAGVSAWAHHPANNRVDALGLLLRGGREVVRGRGRHAIGLQPNAEFGIGPTEPVRLVLGQRIRPIRPLRSWLVKPFNDHPDEAGRGRWLSLHGHVLPGT